MPIVLAALLTPGPSGAQTSSAGATATGDAIALQWAHPVLESAIRSAPRADAREIAPTHFYTEDGFPEVYLVLREIHDSAGQDWLMLRIPMRPNGRTGWVRRAALGPLYRVRTLLIVDRSRPTATLYKDGRPVWRAPIGVGKRSTPTPAGEFWIREKFRTHEAGGLYGPMAFGTSDYSVLTDWPGGGIIGVHGTNEPTLIPGHPSHGCIRVRNSDIRRLWPLMPVGTVVRIH